MSWEILFLLVGILSNSRAPIKSTALGALNAEGYYLKEKVARTTWGVRSQDIVGVRMLTTEMLRHTQSGDLLEFYITVEQ